MASQAGPRGDFHLFALQKPAERAPISVYSNIKAQWQLVGSEMVNMLRLKPLSLQTERTYMRSGIFRIMIQSRKPGWR